MSWLRTLAIGRSPRRTLARAVVLAVLSAGLFGFVLRPARIHGESMAPTVPESGWRFVNLLAYEGSEPERFDIVAIEMVGTRTLYLKRVLGLPEEQVAFRDGVLLIDGAPVEEPYVKFDGPWTVDPVQLGEHEYWVAGDNRSIEYKNHVAGVTERRHIVGRLL